MLKKILFQPLAITFNSKPLHSDLLGSNMLAHQDKGKIY